MAVRKHAHGHTVKPPPLRIQNLVAESKIITRHCTPPEAHHSAPASPASRRRTGGCSSVRLCPTGRAFCLCANAVQRHSVVVTAKVPHPYRAGTLTEQHEPKRKQHHRRERISDDHLVHHAPPGRSCTFTRYGLGNRAGALRFRTLMRPRA